jgi:predicted transcriptional regulator
MAETEPDPIFDTPIDEAAEAAAEAAADAAAEAEIDTGKGIPHARVRAWLESWGKPNELPCPLPPE